MKKQHWISQFFSSKKQIQPSDNRPMTSEEKAIFLYENYYDLLINIAYKKIHNWEIAQDIVQDTFVVVLKKIDEISFEKCHKMPPLLGYILNGKIIDHLRKERKFLYTEYTGDLIDQNQSEQAQDFFCDENVQSYLSVLTAQEAQLIQLRIIEEYSYAEIANLLHINEPAVRKRVERAKKKLKQHFEQNLQKKEE